MVDLTPVPPSLQRAIDRLDVMADPSASVVELAGASGMTARALQYSFRRHLGCTPSQYSRRRRLEAARAELTAATPGDGTTVLDVALRWGFGHPGRFAAVFRQAYGSSPGAVLRSSAPGGPDGLDRAEALPGATEPPVEGPDR